MFRVIQSGEKKPTRTRSIEFVIHYPTIINQNFSMPLDLRFGVKRSTKFAYTNISPTTTNDWFLLAVKIDKNYRKMGRKGGKNLRY